MNSEEFKQMLRDYFSAEAEYRYLIQMNAPYEKWGEVNERRLKLQEQIYDELLTEKDKKLIHQAYQLHYNDWTEGTDLLGECESIGARRIISKHLSHLHHLEEGHNGDI